MASSDGARVVKNRSKTSAIDEEAEGGEETIFTETCRILFVI